MVVGVHRPAQPGAGQRGHHLVDVHVRRRPGAGLEHVHRELLRRAGRRPPRRRPRRSLRRRPPAAPRARSLARAAACLTSASARTSDAGSRSPEIGKFSTARCVCAPHRASAGTRTSPIESCSTRYLLLCRLRHPCSLPGRRVRLAGADRQQRSRGVGEEVVALVVDHDERREVLDLDPPDRLHAELGVLEHLDRADAVLGQPRGRAADRAEVEAAVLGAGLGDRGRAVALGQHDQRAAGLLELVDVGVHPAGRRRARTTRTRSPPGSWPARRSRPPCRAGSRGIGSPASSRSLILACAMSRATTSGPVSDSRVFTG